MRPADLAFAVVPVRGSHYFMSELPNSYKACLEQAPASRTPADQALVEVLAERKRQNEKWGVQNHPMPVWLAILSEEVGEMAQEILNVQYPPPSPLSRLVDQDNLHKEAVQVAAVALQIVEFLNRPKA